MTAAATSLAISEKDYRHNFIVNLLDGVAFFFGSSFIANTTILPLYISRLTDDPLAIGLLATLVSAGYLLPQLFTVNWVRKQQLKKTIPIRLGLISIRLPVLLLAPSALLALYSPQLALIAFFLLMFWQIFGTGAILVSWQDMIAKIFPVNRRGRFMGMTRFLGTASGVLGASAAAWMLNRFEFPLNYAYCFLIAGIFILLSWVFLALTREKPQSSATPPKSQVEFWKELPAIFKADKNFRNYTLSRVIATGNGIALGFLTVYAVQRWDLSDSQAGIFTTCLLIGQAISYLPFGWLADRLGHKLTLEIGYLASVALIGIAFFAPAPSWFYAVFILAGISMAGFMLSGSMIIFELSTPENRPTYIGLTNTIIGLFSALTPLLGGWLVEHAGYRMNFGITFLVSALSLAALHWTVTEPRNLSKVEDIS
jgi:MFS family permease